MLMTTINILTGSTRPGRFNIQPTTWIYGLAKQRKNITVELIDLETVNLPFYDEPVPALKHQYVHAHTKQWARTIGDADGFIFVTPEYNHSYSSVLKNAIDYLNLEWNYKPVSYVSYGSLAGGSRAVEHLRGSAAELKMYDLKEQILFPNYWENMDEKGSFKFMPSHEAQANTLLDSLTYWAEVMKDARTKMHN